MILPDHLELHVYQAHIEQLLFCELHPVHQLSEGFSSQRTFLKVEKLEKHLLRHEFELHDQ